MTEIDKLVTHIRRTLGNLNISLPDAEYKYASVALCVTDAVYSLGVNYKSTERTVSGFCTRYGWEMNRALAAQEHTISDLLRILQPYENRWDEMARIVFRNMQRTSTTSGIRKAEAVYRFAKTLQRFGIEKFSDASNLAARADIRREITAIPGQGSGLSYNYFLILVGDTNAVKADRMVTRFVADGLGVRNVQPEICERLVREASAVLRSEFPKLTPSLLDHAIWDYQRRQDEAAQKACRHTAPIV